MDKGIQVVLRDGGIFVITDEQINYWERIYPELEVRSEIGLLKEMWSVGAMPRRTAKNIIKHINKWLYKQKNSEIQTTIDDYL